MPDITMCRNCGCPFRGNCYRYLAVPSEYRQAYSVFEPDLVARNCVYQITISTPPIGVRTLDEVDKSIMVWNVMEHF